MHHHCDKLSMQSFVWINEKSLLKLPCLRKYACLPAQIPATTVQIAQGHEIKGSFMINSSFISTPKVAIIKFNIWVIAGELNYSLSLVILREFVISWQIFQLFPYASKNNFDVTISPGSSFNNTNVDMNMLIKKSDATQELLLKIQFSTIRQVSVCLKKAHNNSSSILSSLKNKTGKRVLIHFYTSDKPDGFLSLFCKVIHHSTPLALIKIQKDWERPKLHVETEKM